MPQYILLLKGINQQLEHNSPEELQTLFEKYDTWVEDIRAEGKLKQAQKLLDDVRHEVSFRQGQVTDGPFAETKETIGGYFVVETSTMQEAIEIARTCPVVTHGGSVELREIHVGACRYSD